jgi:formiminoglutamate deiminase
MTELRVWFETALLPDGWAANVRCTIADGRFTRVERDTPAADGDERHAIGVPGLPNVHSHAFQRAMAGLAERRSPAGSDSFWTWRETMYRFVERLDPDDVEAVAALAYAEMLESGFTRAGEFHYLHHAPDGRPYANPAEMAARLAAAARETGIGLTLLPSFYAHGGFGAAPLTAIGQRRFVSSLDLFARLVEASRTLIASLDAAMLGLAPHSLRAVAPHDLQALVASAGDTMPLHIHVAEQTKEVDDCLAWSGARPIAWLLDHAPVDGRWCLIHGTHATDAELHAVAARGATIGLCPITEGSLGDGVFDARTFMHGGGAIAVGTDSNILIDAAQELRTIEYVQRLTRRERNVLTRTPGESTGRRLFDAVLAGGSRALGVAAAGVGLVAGAPADLITLARTHTALTGREADALLDGWIFAARTSPIDRVWRGGRLVVSEGRHLHRDAIEARFRRRIAALV